MLRVANQLGRLVRADESKATIVILRFAVTENLQILQLIIGANYEQT